MDESIFITIKKLIGVDDSDTGFNTDIIVHINSVFLTLQQLGIGPKQGFSISGGSEKWSDFLENDLQLNTVKSYMYLKVKMLFDPPTGSAQVESFNRIIKEFEWRLNVSTEEK